MNLESVHLHILPLLTEFNRHQLQSDLVIRDCFAYRLKQQKVNFMSEYLGSLDSSLLELFSSCSIWTGMGRDHFLAVYQWNALYSNFRLSFHAFGQSLRFDSSKKCLACLTLAITLFIRFIPLFALQELLSSSLTICTTRSSLMTAILTF